MRAVEIPTIRERLRSGESILTEAMAKSVRFFPAKTVILEEGNRTTHIFRVISGRATRRRTLSDGRSQLMSILLPGDIVGVQSLFEGALTDTVQAVTDIAAEAVSHSEVHRLASQETNVAIWLISYASHEHQRTENWLRVVTTGTAMEKIAFSLVDLWRRLPRPDNSPLRLPLSQRDLAEHVGLTLPHVCRTIAAMREAGAIEIHYGSIEILDIKPLMESVKGEFDLFGGNAGNQTFRSVETI